MGSVIFKNPNEPEQPAQGVYRWFYVEKGKDKTSKGRTFYVGQAGGKRRGLVRHPSTLSRGVSELQRACFSSDKGHSLDTDFIVGTMILYLKDQGFDCVWEHISDHPREERDFCAEYKPILQDENGMILRTFKLKSLDTTPWRNAQGVKKAQTRLYALFHKAVAQNHVVPDTRGH